MSVHVFSDGLYSFLKDKKFRFVPKFECECGKVLRIVNKSEVVTCTGCGLVWKVNWKSGQVTCKDSLGVVAKQFVKVKTKDIIFFAEEDRNKIFVIGKYDIVKPELLYYPEKSAKEDIKVSVDEFISFRESFISHLLDLSRNDIFCPAPYGNPKSYDRDALLSICNIFKSLRQIRSELLFLVNRVYSHGKTSSTQNK